MDPAALGEEAHTARPESPTPAWPGLTKLPHLQPPCPLPPEPWATRHLPSPADTVENLDYSSTLKIVSPGPSHCKSVSGIQNIAKSIPLTTMGRCYSQMPTLMQAALWTASYRFPTWNGHLSPSHSLSLCPPPSKDLATVLPASKVIQRCKE